MFRNVMFLLLGLLIGWGSRATFANVDDEGFSSINCPEGYVCVTIEEYALHWDVCPIDPNFTPTVTTTPTDGPTETPTTTPTPTIEVTSTPTDDPTKEPKVNCNQGIGNGPDCTPGKSDWTVNPNHPQPPNDELERNVPGNPERKGGGKK